MTSRRALARRSKETKNEGVPELVFLEDGTDLRKKRYVSETVCGRDGKQWNTRDLLGG